MMRRFKQAMILLALVASFLGVISPASALAAGNCSDTNAGFLGFPTWYKYLNVGTDCSFEDVVLPDDLGKILLAGFEIMLRVGGIVAVIFVIYGSIQYIISQGEPENIKNARTTIINALVGLVITMVATGVVNLVGGNIK